jgi:uncharacterized protein YkwD
MSILRWIFGRRPRPVPPVPPPTPGNLPELYVSVNTMRARAGLHPLATDPRLEAVAARRIALMAMAGQLDHAGYAVDIRAVVPDAAPGAAAGEVLAAGQTSAAQVVSDWLRDPAHRAELLGDFTRMGAGVAEGKGGMTYWCVDFAREN